MALTFSFLPSVAILSLVDEWTEYLRVVKAIIELVLSLAKYTAKLIAGFRSDSRLVYKCYANGQKVKLFLCTQRGVDI
jgi:hypothetical protein